MSSGDSAIVKEKGKKVQEYGTNKEESDRSEFETTGKDKRPKGP